MKTKKVFIFLLLFPGMMATTQAAWEPSYALVGCRIVTGAGTPIEDSVMVIRNGLIEAAGPKAKTSIPEDVKSAPKVDTHGFSRGYLRILKTRRPPVKRMNSGGTNEQTNGIGRLYEGHGRP
ncbi:MAG: hypothetical protein IMZ61_08040 [Planctomycetes bacterium]|nr:hypothetical protein [Planctomycetota bacterium]